MQFHRTRVLRAIHQDSTKNDSSSALAYDDACVPNPKQQQRQTLAKEYSKEDLANLDSFSNEQVSQFVRDGSVSVAPLFR